MTTFKTLADPIFKQFWKDEDKLGTLEEAIEFDNKRNYQYTAPVAWINEDGNYIIHNDWKNNPANPDAHYYTIPLYTAPRELSDEEIMNLALEVGWKPNALALLVLFARAILKKASEK